MTANQLVCLTMREGASKRIPLDEALSMDLDRQYESALIKFVGSSVALMRYSSFRRDAYRFMIIKDLLNEEISGGEPLHVYAKGAIPVCGRSIVTYRQEFSSNSEIPLDERVARTRDELFMEIGPGFSELIVREAIVREKRGGVAPLAIDPFDYGKAIALLSACIDLHPEIQVYSDASNPLSVISGREARERMEVLTTPQLVNLVSQFFSKKEHLPQFIQERIDGFGGVHTLVDVCGGGMYVPLEKSTDPEHEMRRLLKPNGKLYSN